MPLWYPTPYTVNEPAPHVPEASSFTWTSPAGRITDLADFGDPTSGICVAPGTIGLGMPEVTLQETDSLIFEGSSIQGQRVSPRQIDLPIQMWGASRLDLLQRWRQLIEDMAFSRKGPGLLSLTRFDGETRSIQGYYIDGLRGEDDDDAWGLTWIRGIVSLRCPSPFWLGIERTRTFATVGDGRDDPDDDPPPANTLFFPFLPLRLSAGLPVVVDPDDDTLAVIGTIAVDNDGGVLSYPVITLTGPCDSLTLTNTNTGQYMTITHGVAAGKFLTIDTRNNARSVVETTPAIPVPNGTPIPATHLNRRKDLVFGSTLWPLDVGLNLIEVSAPGITADSNLSITWQQRFWTGY